MDKTKASTNTSGKPHHAWTSSAPGIAKRQTSDWFARKSHGDYARVPKLSPTTDDGSASSRANSQMSLDSGPDRSSTSGVLFDDMNKEEREKMMATVNGISEVDSRNGTVFGDYKSAVKLARKNSDVLSGESSRVAQRLARLTSPPSSTGTAGSNTGNVKTANLISFREEQPNEPTDLLWLEADSKPTQTASEASRPMFLDSATPKSLSNGICDVKNTRPRTSLETIRQQIRQIESEIRVSNGHRQPPPPSSASSAPHHHPPKTPSQLLAQVNDEERDDDEDGFLGPSFSRPIQPSYSSQSIPANFDSHLVGDFGGGARRRGGSTYGGQQNRTAGHPAFPQSSMQRAYSVDVAVHSAISDIQSAVRRNSMIRLKSSTQTLNRASIDEAPEDDCVWVKRESSAQTDMQQAPHEPRLSGPAGPPLMVPPPPLPTNSRLSSSMTPETDEEMENESRQLLSQENGGLDGGDHCANRIGSLSRPMSARRPSCQSAHDLIEGVLFRCCYLGSTHLFSDSRPTKSSRLNQAQEAVTRIKAPDGESQPMTDVDLFISMEKIMVLNVDIQESLMDHPLRTISYIADIGDLVVLMVKRGLEDLNCDAVLRSTQPKMLCHVFQSDEASMIAQTIGNAFQVAYMEYLKANGIQDDRYLRHLDYLEVLNSQEMSTNELDLFASKDKQINVVIPKQKGEILGVVIVESGWGSMLPTVIIANLCPGGPGARCGKLSIGDQLISINGISLVGLPLAQCQTTIKNAKNLTVVKLTIVSCPPVVEVKIKRPDTRYQLGFSVQNGIICSLLRGGIAERGGIRVGHRIIEINSQSVVATDHENIVNMLAHSVGAIELKTMPSSIFRLLTGQDTPVYI